jgi:hypothetical protein
MQFGRLFRRMGLPGWTFIGIGISAIWFNTLSGLLVHFLGDLFQSNTHIGFLRYAPEIVAIALPFAMVFVVAQWQASRFQLHRLLIGGSELRRPERKRVLILLVSTPTSAEYAIRYHMGELVPHKQLKKIFLIHSNDDETGYFGSSSKPVAEEIAKLVHDLGEILGCKPPEVRIMAGVSPGDAQDTFDRVNRVYREAGFEPKDIIADFTGGTKPMTTGMIMACLPPERELEYVALNSKRQMNGPFLIDYQHSAFGFIG